VKGFAAEDEDAPPNRELVEVVEGAPNGDGADSFLSPDGALDPKVNPVVVELLEGGAPKRPVEVEEGAAEPKEKGAGEAVFGFDVDEAGSASSSIPLSPSASSVPATEAGPGGARAPKGEGGAEGIGVEAFSSAVGVAGVVPKVKVALAVEVVGGTEGVEPKENEEVDAGFVVSSTGFEAPKEKEGADEAEVEGVGLKANGDAAGADSVFCNNWQTLEISMLKVVNLKVKEILTSAGLAVAAAPNENIGLATSSFFSTGELSSVPVFPSLLSLMISLTGLPKAANGFEAGTSFFSFSVSDGPSVELIAGVDEVEPKVKEGRGAALGVSSFFSAMIDPKKFGLAPSEGAGRVALGTAGVEVEGVAKENPLEGEVEGAEGLGAKRSAAGGVGLKRDDAGAGFELAAPKEIAGRGGMTEVEGAEVPKEKAGLSVEGTGAAESRLKRLDPSSFFSESTGGEVVPLSAGFEGAGAPNEKLLGNFIAGI